MKYIRTNSRERQLNELEKLPVGRKCQAVADTVGHSPLALCETWCIPAVPCTRAGTKLTTVLSVQGALSVLSAES